MRIEDYDLTKKRESKTIYVRGTISPATWFIQKAPTYVLCTIHSDHISNIFKNNYNKKFDYFFNLYPLLCSTAHIYFIKHEVSGGWKICGMTLA